MQTSCDRHIVEDGYLEDERKVVGNIVCSPWWFCGYHLDDNAANTPDVAAAAIALST